MPAAERGSAAPAFQADIVTVSGTLTSMVSESRRSDAPAAPKERFPRFSDVAIAGLRFRTFNANTTGMTLRKSEVIGLLPQHPTLFGQICRRHLSDPESQHHSGALPAEKNR